MTIEQFKNEQQELEKSWNYYMNLYISLNNKPDVERSDLTNLLLAINGIQVALNSVREMFSSMEQNLDNTEEVEQSRQM